MFLVSYATCTYKIAMNASNSFKVLLHSDPKIQRDSDSVHIFTRIIIAWSSINETKLLTLPFIMLHYPLSVGLDISLKIV